MQLLSSDLLDCRCSFKLMCFINLQHARALLFEKVLTWALTPKHHFILYIMCIRDVHYFFFFTRIIICLYKKVWWCDCLSNWLHRDRKVVNIGGRLKGGLRWRFLGNLQLHNHSLSQKTPTQFAKYWQVSKPILGCLANQAHLFWCPFIR